MKTGDKMNKAVKKNRPIKIDRQIDMDILKGIGIFMVVLGHLKPDSILRTHIYSCHMFIFFFASGLLFNAESNIFKHIWKKMKRLLIPYLVWNFLGQYAEYVFEGAPVEELINQMWMIDGKIGWNAPVWYLLAIFWIDTIYVLIHRFLTKKSVLAISIAAFWFAYILAEFEIIFPLGFQYVPVGLAFFCLGSWCRMTDVKTRVENGIFRKTSGYLVILASIFVVNIFFGVINNDMISVFHVNYTNYLFTIIAGIAGVFFYWFLSYAMTGSWFFSNLGKNTLIILCSHYFILRCLTYVSLNTIGLDLWNHQSSVKAIIIASLIVLFYTLISPVLGIIRKYVPIIRWLV